LDPQNLVLRKSFQRVRSLPRALSLVQQSASLQRDCSGTGTPHWEARLPRFLPQALTHTLLACWPSAVCPGGSRRRATKMSIPASSNHSGPDEQMLEVLSGPPGITEHSGPETKTPQPLSLANRRTPIPPPTSLLLRCYDRILKHTSSMPNSQQNMSAGAMRVNARTKNIAVPCLPT
jgi:hypothetical protein